jgi:hypothetical protein
MYASMANTLTGAGPMDPAFALVLFKSPARQRPLQEEWCRMFVCPKTVIAAKAGICTIFAGTGLKSLVWLRIGGSSSSISADLAQIKYLVGVTKGYSTRSASVPGI